MKRFLLILVFLTVCGIGLRAQDSTVVAVMDSTLLGKDIFTMMGPGVKITQTQTVRNAFNNYVRNNAGKTLSGYRIRVFYDSGPQARTRSEVAERTARSLAGGAAVYRTFESPNYKVTVGDFRTKDEALRTYSALKSSFPTAYIIKETINYPR